MAMFPTEMVRIVPMAMNPSTASAANYGGKVRIDGGIGDWDVYCHAGVIAATGISATSTAGFTFTLTEGTSRDAAGSAITGGSITIGGATALYPRGMIAGSLYVASDAATTVGITMGFSGQGTSGDQSKRTFQHVTAGATARAGGYRIADEINGVATRVCGNAGMPHWEAKANYGSSNLTVGLHMKDDDAQALDFTLVTGGNILRMDHCAGIIHGRGLKLSTHNPKYLGIVVSTEGAASVIGKSAYLVSVPRGMGTPGLTTDATA